MAEEAQTTTLHFLDYWRVIRDRKEVILAVALLTIVTGTAYTLMMPQKFTPSLNWKCSKIRWMWTRSTTASPAAWATIRSS